MTKLTLFVLGLFVSMVQFTMAEETAGIERVFKAIELDFDDKNGQKMVIIEEDGEKKEIDLSGVDLKNAEQVSELLEGVSEQVKNTVLDALQELARIESTDGEDGQHIVFSGDHDLKVFKFDDCQEAACENEKAAMKIVTKGLIDGGSDGEIKSFSFNFDGDDFAATHMADVIADMIKSGQFTAEQIEKIQNELNKK